MTGALETLWAAPAGEGVDRSDVSVLREIAPWNYHGLEYRW